MQQLILKKYDIIKLLFVILVINFISCTTSEPYQDENFNLDLAYRWAPVNFQDTRILGTEADYITRFDYDGNYIANDNWENLENGDLSAYGYYSVVETASHWYLIFAYFHPRDRSIFHVDQHENDIEGLLMIIKKDGSEFGSFVAMFTFAHGGTYSVVPNGTNLTRKETIFNQSIPEIDGFNNHVFFALYDGEYHPVITQDTEGHGLYAFPDSDFQGFDDEDGIIYFPSKTIAEKPSSRDDRNVKYKLINIFNFNLWTKQLFDADEFAPHETFALWGRLNGDKLQYNPLIKDFEWVPSLDAMAPWFWDVYEDYPSYRGLMALDPAKLTFDYFEGLGDDFSLTYTKNRYLYDLQNQGYTDSNEPYGWLDAQTNLSTLYSKLE